MDKQTQITRLENQLETMRVGGELWGDKVRREKADSELPPELIVATKEIRAEVLYRVIYRGYLEREQRQIEKQKHVEKILIPASMDYLTIPGLRKESALKLNEFRPFNLGQASRISGVNPADISILMVRIAAAARAAGKP